MKKFLMLAVAAFVLLVGTGCEPKEKINPIQAGIIGEWQLVSWSDGMSDEVEVYAEFKSDMTFVLYQKVQYVYFVKYTGQYLVTDNVVSGTYDDGKAWGASYTVTLSNNGQNIEMVNTMNIDDISLFAKTTIPQEVLNGAITMTSRGEEVYMLDRFL
jgi:hypothetical protein